MFLPMNREKTMLFKNGGKHEQTFFTLVVGLIHP